MANRAARILVFFGLCVGGLVALLSCRKQEDPTPSDEPTSDVVQPRAAMGLKSQEVSRPSVRSQSLSVHQPTAVGKTMKRWLDGTNGRDPKILDFVYAEDVQFYGVKMSGHEAAKRSVEIYANVPDMRAAIIKPFQIHEESSGDLRVRFTKQISTKESKKSYPAYLVLRLVGDTLRVIQESDDVTDENLRFPDCESVARAIMWTFLEEKNLSGNSAATEGRPSPTDPHFYFRVGWFDGEFVDGLGHLQGRGDISVHEGTGAVGVSCDSFWDIAPKCGENEEYRPVPFNSNLVGKLQHQCTRSAIGDE